MFKLNFDEAEFEISQEFLDKYNQVAPRYTSYPTAPEWQELSSSKATELWQEALEKSCQSKRELSLYFHVPFCRAACYYCACNIVVNPYNKLSDLYVQILKKEIRLLARKLNASKNRLISQIHFGGGTPTYLSSQELKKLFNEIKENFPLSSPESEISIEIDPRVTSLEQLESLREVGFNRVSLGIQDFDPKVQKAVNRIQSFSLVSKMLKECRALGYQSINFDLIYGLPFQTLDSFRKTINLVLELDPDRIALFNYAHVPSLRPFQKKYIDPQTLPSAKEKFLIFCQAMKDFSGTKNGSKYKYIGLDHFAKWEDELSVAQGERTLWRNFQGYTTKASNCDLFGLGMTSISSINEEFYTQNEKKLNLYLDADFTSNPPITKGLKLNQDDLLRKEIINNLLCNEELNIKKIEEKYQIDFFTYFERELLELAKLEKDQLIRISSKKIEIKTLGKIFLRNIAMNFDSYLRNLERKSKTFSRTL